MYAYPKKKRAFSDPAAADKKRKPEATAVIGSAQARRLGLEKVALDEARGGCCETRKVGPSLAI